MLDPIELGRPPVTAYSTARKAPIGKHAIALGASMAGLLAARVLGDFYTTVTVVERGTLGDTAAVRKGVPQGRHTHGLLMRGAQALEELFPGFLDQLIDDGAVVFDGADLSQLPARWLPGEAVQQSLLVCWSARLQSRTPNPVVATGFSGTRR
jgi:predicted NAD/FAD-dependent oxidoreductase